MFQLANMLPPPEFDILNFALTLEHLEDAFYSQGLANYSAQDFQNAGYNSSVRGRYEQIAFNEHTHVLTLEKTLGKKAVQACEYSL
jgi:hypothetical protein